MIKCKWYHGPSVKNENIIKVFKCQFTPSRETHAGLYSYTFGPFTTRKAAMENAAYQFPGRKIEAVSYYK